jgi:hypothetical protein
MMQKWFSTKYLMGGLQGQVDRENGRIYGVSVNTEGEAKGHDVHLDESFIEAVIDQGNEKRAGVKARFGHPNMCSTALGTFIGRFKNFRKESVVREDGSPAFRAVADLYLSATAKETPHGDLYEYVLNMAENEPDMFGTSIVFEVGQYYRRDRNGNKVYGMYEREDLSEELYVELGKLHACDVVDEPAANDGLFSRFSRESVAGQVTEFLDLNPEIWTALCENPDVIDVIRCHADKVDEFFERYREHRAHNQKGEEQMSNVAEPVVAAPAVDACEPEASESDVMDVVETAEPVEVMPEEDEAAAETALEADPVVEALADEPAEAVVSEPEQVVVVDVNKQAPPAPTEPPADLRSEFARMRDAFGVEVAAEIFEAGGTYQDALALAYERKCKEAEDLRVQAISQPVSAGYPAGFSATPQATKVDERGVHELFRRGTRSNR